MITFEWIIEVLNICQCFICHKKFINNNNVGEFFGALAHWEYLDKKFKNNDIMRKNERIE